MEITVKQSSALRRKLAELSSLGDIVMMQAGRDTADYLRRYHVRFREKWQGDRYMAGPRSNLFWQQVVAGWQDPVVSGKRVTITNTFGLLAWKVRGGDIYPKNESGLLTIPLIPEAKGLSVAEFASPIHGEGTPLFRAGNALCRRIGKQLQAVYALSDWVHQEPWPGALPEQADIKAVFVDSVRRQVRAIARQT